MKTTIGFFYNEVIRMYFFVPIARSEDRTDQKPPKAYQVINIQVKKKRGQNTCYSIP
jgi:hypothetical protein